MHWIEELEKREEALRRLEEEIHNTSMSSLEIDEYKRNADVAKKQVLL